MWYVYRTRWSRTPPLYNRNRTVGQMCTCKITSRVRVRKKWFSYMQNWVILHVDVVCFSYMHNWGPSVCRCGMFFVQGGPEPELGSEYVDVVCFSYKMVQNQNWGPSACRCGMFFVQGGPEPALYILLGENFHHGELEPARAHAQSRPQNPDSKSTVQ